MSAEATSAARGCIGVSSGQGPMTRTDALLESIAWSLLSIAESLDEVGEQVAAAIRAGASA